MTITSFRIRQYYLKFTLLACIHSKFKKLRGLSNQNFHTVCINTKFAKWCAKFTQICSCLTVFKWAVSDHFAIISALFQQTPLFLQQINVNPVYGAGIRTHNLQNMTLLLSHDHQYRAAGQVISFRTWMQA